MPEQKTKENNLSVDVFINAIPDEIKRKDAVAILRLLKNVTKKEPRMWGNSIVGFGSYHYKYASGHEGDACIVGFSPRKQNLVLYLMMMGNHADLLKKLGKHKTGKGCLYINKLSDVNIEMLKELIEKSFLAMQKHIEKEYK